MVSDFLKQLGIQDLNQGSWINDEIVATEEKIDSVSPVDGKIIASVTTTTDSAYDSILESATRGFQTWRTWPAPKRGEIVRLYGDLLRKNKANLGKLVSYEMGKSLQEGEGEVQEMIDICDFAVGLSRQLYGNTMHSERENHRMYEQWHPLGVVGIISAFNFPVAVWSWNAMIALVCGNSVVWKPSEKTPLCGVVCQKLLAEVLSSMKAPRGISCLVTGGAHLGQKMASDSRVPLVSATGSTQMGRSVAEVVGKRLGKTILELGGNNAIIVSNKANIDLAIRAIVFGAVGTAGQRCTSTRRVFIHKEIYEQVKKRLTRVYHQIKIGSPLDPENLMGPLIDVDAVHGYLTALGEVEDAGGTFLVAGGQLDGSKYESGCYVKPCIAEVKNEYEIVQKETFAPILYLMSYEDLSTAIHMQNDVRQGLSSAIFTESLNEAELFLSSVGSDCGIANVNIGTSGAEIGGAFGGEKETGGGRESGSDSWKAYMRRQTNTINYGDTLPLAQGISFDL